jgi:hypothetical protein
MIVYCSITILRILKIQGVRNKSTDVILQNIYFVITFILTHFLRIRNIFLFIINTRPKTIYFMQSIFKSLLRHKIILIHSILRRLIAIPSIAYSTWIFLNAGPAYTWILLMIYIAHSDHSLTSIIEVIWKRKTSVW